ncbi:MAG TPA: adenylate/guanylate cyclase domain-containing protein [Burkholderiales bacterium]|nr:adenylate/guanylate cyclase domain-containing protein [Burkholderiales bacterium]
MDAAAPTLAVLFAQISGSAALYGLFGDSQAAAAVSACHAGLKAAAEKHRGTVVKTMGDELIARFDSADLALQAAAAMQAFMRGQTDKLALKVGFNVGPVIQEKQDVFGDAVNLAARMATLANPRQILTTRQTVDLLPPFLRSTCRSLYTTTVRGKSEKIALYEAVWHQDKGTTVVGDPGADEATGPAKLKLSYRGRTWNLDERSDVLNAGRDPVSEIVVAGDKVSRHHARVFMRQGKFVVVDQSANGTFVRVQQRAEIQLNREEFILLGRGSIGLGQSVAEAGEDAIAFEFE